MKVFLSVVLCVMLCIQPVLAQEDTEAGETAESEMPGSAEEQEGAKTQEDDRVEETSETQENSEGQESAGTEEPSEQAGPQISAPSAILMEASTGQVIYEKNPDEQRPPASVTKVMTLLLIFDAIESGQIRLEDMVTTSEYAASMGGSQVFLEPGEEQTVETMIKCIVVASANDACVAMAEYIAGSEEEFVKRMNERAAGLGMANTHFVNCNGLDTDGHLTTARDIGLMSRELITSYPQIRDYTMIWMENITHTTEKGTTEFGLTNTNKLVRYYEGATGLKTGSTDAALYCLSATAEKEGMELIAVILGAPTSNDRFEGAKALLNYGFATYALVPVAPSEPLTPVPVTLGTAASVQPGLAQERQLLLPKGEAGKVTTTVDLPSALSAPVEAGQELGHLTVLVDGQAVEEIPLVAQEAVGKRSLWQVYGGLLAALFCGAGEAGF